ncbi:sugar-binding protein [Desmospora profundinema]|uniref:Ribose transport system substrate-binding protein n=1 Tax=Desmospora profundinema TaxID=1571184 RepID=A0ABU1IPY5_9BACL|nr:sugar-binding protein [Desmospora profundinema]MDR6226861.1 ribose transport system substrate-binding protein [Desmospora profundinema]
MFKRVLLLCTILMLALSLGTSVYFAGKAREAHQPIERKPVDHRPEHHLVFISQEMGSPFWREMERGARAAAEGHDVVIEFRSPVQPNYKEHVSLIEMAVASQVDGIITQGLTDQGFAPAINHALDRGIQVITVDSDVMDSKRFAYVGTHHYRAGYRVGQEMVRAMGEEGKVGIILSSKEENNMIQRMEGFQDAIRSYPGIQVVAVEESNASLRQASEKAAKIFNTHPDVKGLFGISPPDAPGLVEVAEERGKTGEVVIMGFGDLPQTFRLVEEGKLTGVVVQQPYEIGYRSVESMMALLKGKQPSRELYIPFEWRTSQPLQGSEGEKR